MGKKAGRMLLIIFGILVFASLLAGCQTSYSRPSLLIVSRGDSEQLLLTEMMKQLVESRTDYRVEHRILSAESSLYQSKENQSFDIYPGTGEQDLLNMAPGFATLKNYNFSAGITLAMKRQEAEKLGIQSISDLLSYNGKLRLGIIDDFQIQTADRRDISSLLRSTYGLEFPDFLYLSAAEEGTAINKGWVQILALPSTSGKLIANDLVSLLDDRKLLPAHHGATIMRSELLQNSPELRTLMNQFAISLSLEDMIRMRFFLENEYHSKEVLAASFLREKGLLK